MVKIIEYIKRPRQLRFDSWRYRLLHWTFSTNPISPQESNLPNFLYTHYCPLFHLTNLLVFAAPFVGFAKLVAWGICSLPRDEVVYDHFSNSEKRSIYIRKQQLKDRIERLIAISQRLFKFVLNVLYVVLLIVVFTTIISVPFMVFFFLSTEDILDVLVQSAIGAAISLSCAGICYLATRKTSINSFKFVGIKLPFLFIKTLNKLFAPFKVAINIVVKGGDLFITAINFCINICSKIFKPIGEFVSMFYETNCPPIEIIESNHR